MSLRFRRRYRKKYYGRRSYKKVAYRALKTAYRAKKQLRGELFYKDTTWSEQTIPNTLTLKHLTPVAQNDDVGDRTGDRIMARRLTVRYELKNQSAGAGAATRIIIFAYAQDRRLEPTVTGDDYSVLEANNVLSPLSYKNRKMFKIFHDETYTGSPDSTTQWVRKLNINLAHAVNYTSSSATSYSKGHMWMFCLSNDPTNSPKINMYCRFRYSEQ